MANFWTQKSRAQKTALIVVYGLAGLTAAVLVEVINTWLPNARPWRLAVFFVAMFAASLLYQKVQQRLDDGSQR